MIDCSGVYARPSTDLRLPPPGVPDPADAENEDSQGKPERHRAGVLANELCRPFPVPEREQRFAEVAEAAAGGDRDEEVDPAHSGHAGGEDERLERHWRWKERRNGDGEKPVLPE